MGYLSRNDLEKIATCVFNGYKRLPRFVGLQVDRVDPEILACELCGFHVDYYHLSRDKQILGMTAFRELEVEVYNDSGQPFFHCLDGRSILIEADLKNDPAQCGRHNFTLAHETAHQILANLFQPNKSRIICYKGRSPRYSIHDWDEWQADNLASALLLPIELIYRALRRFGLEHGIGMLNRVYRPKEYTRFCDMAEYLGTSKQAMAIRLKRLGLLKKEHLRNPYAPADVEMHENEIEESE